MRHPVGRIWAAMVLAVALAACGSTPKEATPDGPAVGAVPEPLPSAPEPAQAPEMGAEPVGQVVPVGTAPEGLVVDSTSGRVMVGLREPDGVVLLDLDGNLVTRVDLDGAPRHLSLSEPGGPVLVPAEGSDQLIVMNLPDGDIASVTPVGRQPHDAASAGGRIFAANEFAESVSVIDDGAVIGEVPAPLQPGGIAATANRVGVVGVRARQTKVFDATSLDEVATVTTGEGPTHIEGSGDRFFVADTTGGAVLVLSASSPSAEPTRIDLPGAPYGMAVDAARQRLWVTLTGRNEVVAFDISGDEPVLVTTLPSVRQPNSVAIDAESGAVYVAGTADGVLQIIPPNLTG